MCGIAGEIGSRRFVGYSDEMCRKMTRSLTHRGPDDEGYFTEMGDGYMVHLGMRRLSIIDREGGQQPMGDTVKVVFNGEIYNHKEVRTYLEGYGIRFKTNCDTEVVTKGWEFEGRNIIKRLNGMFAFAVWEKDPGLVTLVRDRMGKKPLYYHLNKETGTLLFGSEIKAILENPLYERRINHEAIYNYLCLQYCPEPDTAFEGIECLPPGSYVMYEPGRSHIHKYAPYWELKPDQVEGVTPDNMVQRVRDTMRVAVSDRLESEVPLGVYLSGGVDSSIITGLVREAIGPDAELHTFSMGFLESNFNELPFADAIAAQFHTDHHSEIVKQVCFRDMAERIANQYDQPFGDCSAIPTMLMAERSKKYITVALSGDGGDECFGGYSRYWAADAHTGMEGYIPFMFVWPPRTRAGLMTPEFRRNVPGYASSAKWLLNHANKFKVRDTKNQMQ